jgi:ADP-ribosylglycohydrolase
VIPSAAALVSLGLPLELAQSTDEGKDVAAFASRIAALAGMAPGGPERGEAEARLYEDVQAARVPAASLDREPSGLPGIRALSPAHDADGSGPGATALPGPAALRDRIHGAWLGRCAGCLLGKPVETWRRGRLVGLLQATGNWPLRHFLSSRMPADLRSAYGVTDTGAGYGTDRAAWIDAVSCMPEDDDISFMLVALRTLELRGRGFSASDVGERWLSDLPALHVFTAERNAYRNLLAGILPPESASVHNPCREWVGAQIRADIYGYVNPGDPAAATDMAWRDASVSHTRNGIYGALFVAALLSTAAVASDPEDMAAIVRAGLAWIPRESRYAAGIRGVLAWHEEGASAQEAADRIHRSWDETNDHHWCHAVPNGMVVCIGLLWGRGDLARSLGAALQAAFDTDCNCATVGSVVGMARGAAALPRAWTRPLRDTIESGVHGFTRPRISQLAARTSALVGR